MELLNEGYSNKIYFIATKFTPNTSRPLYETDDVLSFDYTVDDKLEYFNVAVTVKQQMKSKVSDSIFHPFISVSTFKFYKDHKYDLEEISFIIPAIFREINKELANNSLTLAGNNIP